jgi:hypothetical protein
LRTNLSSIHRSLKVVVNLQALELGEMLVEVLVEMLAEE